jgi:hypothetical protein
LRRTASAAMPMPIKSSLLKKWIASARVIMIWNLS